MLDELMEADERAKPRVVAVGLEIQQNLLSDTRPFTREIMLHDLAHTHSKLYPAHPQQLSNSINCYTKIPNT